MAGLWQPSWATRWSREEAPVEHNRAAKPSKIPHSVSPRTLWPSHLQTSLTPERNETPVLLSPGGFFVLFWSSLLLAAEPNSSRHQGFSGLAQSRSVLHVGLEGSR